jgi:hypothetical protein
MNKLHGSREEFRFHKMWSEAFKRAEKESLFGIGFNPYLVENYTTENIIDYLEIYKSKRRYQPTKSFRVAIKWLVVCIMILIFGLRGIDSYFLYVVEKIEIYEKDHKKILQKQEFFIKKLRSKESSVKKIKAKLIEKDNKIKNLEKDNEKQKSSKNYKTKRICQSAKVISTISASKNILIGTVYKNGDGHVCKIYLDRTVENGWNIYKRVGNKLCATSHCQMGDPIIQHIEVNN